MPYRTAFELAEYEAMAAYWTELRCEAVAQNMLLGRPIMEQAAWENLDEQARAERVVLAILTTHYHLVAQHYPIARDVVREKLWNGEQS